MASTEQGPLTRVGQRKVAFAFPQIPASGPTPAVPSASVGQYSRTLMLNESDKGKILYPDIHRVFVNHFTYFKMRGMDHNTNGLYDTWTVIGAADFTASLYVGALATPLRDVVVAATWTT